MKLNWIHRNWTYLIIICYTVLSVFDISVIRTKSNNSLTACPRSIYCIYYVLSRWVFTLPNLRFYKTIFLNGITRCKQKKVLNTLISDDQ